MKKPADPEAVLYAFAAEATHDRSTLERYLKQYPELAEELVDLSFELRLNETLPFEQASGQVDPGLDLAWKEFIGCMPEQPATSGAADLFAHYKGQAFVALAASLSIPRSILTALRDGLVEPASIPKGFILRFADAIAAPLDTVRESLSRSREASAALAFKSDVKPMHQGQTTFRKLVQSTEMTDEQRLLLLRECDEDELP